MKILLLLLLLYACKITVIIAVPLFLPSLSLVRCVPRVTAIDIAVSFPKKCNGRVLSTTAGYTGYTPAKSVESGAITRTIRDFSFQRTQLGSRSFCFFFRPIFLFLSCHSAQKNGTLHGEVVNNP